MTITPFGLIFITLGFTLLVARPAWLLPLLIVSAVLHAFAVAIIGPATPNVGLGITPWLFTCGLIFIHLLAIIIRNQRIELGVSRPVKLLFWGWMIFIGWCVLSAFTLPFIFEGTPVYPLNWLGFDGPLQPLAWNRIYAIQAVNSIIMGILFVYVLQLPKNGNITNRLVSGFIIAILAAISIGFYQWFELFGIISAPLNLLHQSLNPSYSQDLTGTRPHWPFSESSYASVWYSGVSTGGLVIYVFTKRSWLGLSSFLAGFAGLLISQGGSGLAGFALALLMLIATLVVMVWREKIPLKRTLWRLTLMIVLVGLTVISYKTARENWPKLPDIYSSVQSNIMKRTSGPIYKRGPSNLNAIAITKSTWGLGGGLGSNRASSYLLSMMSNIGIPGLVLFLILLAYQSYLIAVSSTTGTILKALILGGTVGMFSGMIMGIPDLMFPAWWIWLIAAFGFIASSQHVRPVQSG